MHKLLVNQALYSQGLHATQVLGTFFDGIARHTPEGFDFQRRAAEAGFKEAVRERDEPFGDFGARPNVPRSGFSRRTSRPSARSSPGCGGC